MSVRDKLNSLYTDLLMLRDGDWEPDREGADASILTIQDIADTLGITLQDTREAADQTNSSVDMFTPPTANKKSELKEPLPALIIMAVKQTGSYDPSDIMPCFEEQLTGDQYQTAHDFLSWVHTQGLEFGSNIQEVYANYKRSQSCF